MTLAITSEGTLIGTPQYMAPEQIEGREPDARTDIFALGCVIYEMLTGRRAFEGKTQASIIAKILEGTPPRITELQTTTPAVLATVIDTCLAKNPDDRWQSAADVKRALQLAAAAPASVEPNRPGKRWLWPAAAALIAGAACAGAAVWYLKPHERKSRLEFAVNPPTDTVFLSAGTNEGGSAISPDGTTLGIFRPDQRQDANLDSAAQFSNQQTSYRNRRRIQPVLGAGQQTPRIRDRSRSEENRRFARWCPDHHDDTACRPRRLLEQR